MTDIDAVLLIEGGEATYEQQLEAMQALVDSGTVWHLQGSYGRAAARLIEAGELTPGPAHSTH